MAPSSSRAASLARPRRV